MFWSLAELERKEGRDQRVAVADGAAEALQARQATRAAVCGRAAPSDQAPARSKTGRELKTEKGRYEEEASCLKWWALEEIMRLSLEMDLAGLLKNKATKE